ncbi:type I-E CRISPR-associated protein Cas5/CasD [Glycomyces harbinensis]|uniref:CRISPR system Cascade subunit CasD n=1 Tax=Glycomyces harbinensis TaxID=58114 RepID=A0A1G6YDR9_9ACTN|nr:type I-E CRISPR-associated protein Cas5/CasD [Glycomyces harbinensis]SDD87736.1 CRISPR system Cascade subunit CasD [Glycomyces harbinensis]
MTEGMILRLAGPLQSWGERSTFTVRDSAAFPTRSGILGMAAAAEGINRTIRPPGYDDLEMILRIDRPGTRTVDFHTAGGGYPPEGTAATAGGGHKNAAVVSHRHYLADAAFTVAITGPATVIARLVSALDHPHWAPYLGRRSCPPDEPLLVARSVTDPVNELRTRVPLAARSGRHRNETPIPVDFIWETPPAGTAIAIDIADRPAASPRQFHTRRIWRTTEYLPAALLPHPGGARARLIDYALGSTTR